jgi:hypothetical protein
MLRETEAEEKRERRDEEARAGAMGLGDVECWTWLI